MYMVEYVLPLCEIWIVIRLRIYTVKYVKMLDEEKPYLSESKVEALQKYCANESCLPTAVMTVTSSLSEQDS